MPYIVEYEKNAATVTTSATGTGSVAATKLSQLAAAIIQTPGYVAQVTSVSGQTINFSLYQQSAATGALTAPATAVTFDPGTIQILEIGN